MTLPKSCVLCGEPYYGYHNSLYCPVCAKDRKKESNRKRFWGGNTRGRKNNRTGRAYCPRCETWHKTSTDYTGNGVLREYCDNCRRLVADIQLTKSYRVYA